MPKAQESDTPKNAPLVSRWIKRIDAYKKASKTWREETKDAWDEYLANQSADVQIMGRSRRPRQFRTPKFWATVQTIQPSYYSRTPDPVAKRRLDTGSADTAMETLARLGSLSIERLGTYLIDQCSFDRVMYSTRDECIMSSKGTNRVIYSFNSKKETSKKKLNKNQDSEGNDYYTDDEDEPVTDLTGLTEESGEYYQVTEKEVLQSEQSLLIPVCYTDYGHNPDARYWEEVRYIYFINWMTKDDVAESFGKDIAKKLKFGKKDKDTDERSEAQKQEKVTPVYEIWCKESKTIYHLSPDYSEDFLQEPQKDTWDLPGFFPCPPFYIDNCGPDSLFPVNIYTQVKDLLEQLNGAQKRLYKLLVSTQRRGIVDGNVPELAKINNNTQEAEFLVVNNFKELVSEKGGLEQLVQYFPVGELSQAMQEVIQLNQVFDERIDMALGLPDIIQGVSDPIETAAAQKIKGKYAGQRQNLRAREFTKLVVHSIRLMVHLALKEFDSTTLSNIFGVSSWAEDEQPLFEQVLALLRDPVHSNIEIDIETDSSILMDDEQEVANRTQFVQTALQGVSQVLQVGQGNPAVMKVAAEILMLGIRGLKYGKIVEHDLEKALQQLSQPAPQGPPPPDYEMMKLQNEQASIQNDAQKVQADMQRVQADVNKSLISERIAMQEMYSKMQIAQMEMAIKQQELFVEAQKNGDTAQITILQQQLDARIQSFDEWYKAQQILNERMTIANEDKGRMTEEQRLALKELQVDPAIADKETQQEALKAQATGYKAAADMKKSESKQAPPTTIINAPSVSPNVSPTVLAPQSPPQTKIVPIGML